MIKNNITKKINVDDFDSLKHFEIYFFNYLKNIELWKEIWIIIFSLKNDEKLFDFIANDFIPKIIKIDKFLISNNIIIKFFNFPFCITKDEQLIKKYFISDIFYNKIYVIPKLNSKCYECKHYFICSWNKETNFSNFKTDLILKADFIKNINLVLDFFENIWINRNFIYFDFLFDLDFNFENLNNNLTKKIELFIDWTSWILYNNYFLDTNNEVEWVRTNLFFKNYINQKKFQQLLKKIDFSIFVSYTNFDIELYKTEKNIFKEDDNWIKTYNWINYWFLRKKTISMYLNENIVFKKNILDWSIIKWNIWFFNNKDNISHNLKVIHLKDIYGIKSDFSKYVVLFFEHDLNLHIPYIYKFKYFISFNKLEELAHYSIILREIWASYVDWIWTWYFYWLNNWDLLNINFCNWIIKKIW